MQLIPNWREVISHAWSMRLIAIAAVLEAIEVALPYFSDAMPSGVFSITGLIVSVAALVARIVAQPRTLPAPVVIVDSQDKVL